MRHRPLTRPSIGAAFAAPVAVAVAVAVVVAVGVVGLPASARADDSVFDFVAPRPDQLGDYAPDANATIANGFGKLGVLPGWFDEAWAYRFALVVRNDLPIALTEWPVLVSIDAATAAGFDILSLARPGGDDLRVVVGTTPIDRVSLGLWDLAGNRGLLWFQAASLAPGDNALSLYFTNPEAPGIDDPTAVFSYSSPYPSRHLLDPEGDAVVVASPLADNDYQSGAASGILQAGDLVTIDAADWTTGQAVSSTGAVEVGTAGQTAIGAAPVAFARRVHAVVINRGDDNTFSLLSPHTDTAVTVSVNGAAVDTVNLTAGVATLYANDVPANAVVRFDATAPILVGHRSIADNNDGFVLPPPAPEVWGVRSGAPRVLAVETDTDITVFDSAGGVTTASIAAGAFATLTAGGSGDGDALHIVAVDSGTGQPAPITVIGTADGDGGDAIALHGTVELGRTWIVPTDGHFAVVALTAASSSCTLTPPGGAPTVATAPADVVPPFPTRVQFGDLVSPSVLAGSIIACDAPGFAYYEDAGTDDERNLYPLETHRKGAELDPVASFGATLDTRYRAGVVAIIDTPDVVAPSAVTAWTDFRVATDEPAGSRVQYQLSLDGGARFLIPSGGDWIEAPDPDVGVTDEAIRDAIGALDTSTGQLRVRSLLLSEDGVTTPAIDAIRVFFNAADRASRLRWDPTPEAAISGQSFAIGITAVNNDGLTMTGITGPVQLSASHGGPVIPASVMMTAGRIDAEITLVGLADDIVINAVGPQGLVGSSAMLDLLAPDGQTFALEVFDGDNQIGPLGALLGEPLAVRVTDTSGAPAVGIAVRFSVTEGGGNLEPGGGATVSATDVDGVATARLRLGALAGANRVLAEAGGQQVEFVARADDPNQVLEPRVDSGCKCDAGGSGDPWGGALLALATLALLALPTRRAQLAVHGATQHAVCTPDSSSIIRLSVPSSSSSISAHALAPSCAAPSESRT